MLLAIMDISARAIRVLADIDADDGNYAVKILRHGVLLVFGAPLPASIAGGAGARPDHPISGHQPVQPNGQLKSCTAAGEAAEELNARA
jgi:hypothetical protein